MREMRDRGIEGTGNFPTSWKVSRLCYESYIRARLGWKGLKADEYVDEGYAFISAFNIQSGHMCWEHLNYITQERYDESPEIKLQIGDVLLVKDGAGVGKCARIDALPCGEAAPNSSIAVITPKTSLSYRYVCYYLQSAAFFNFVLKLYNGMGVPHLTQEVMRKIDILIPPIQEQCLIADFLDAKCAEIDLLISDIQAQIDTLEQYKRSVITEAVTKGLNPNVEMKDSGVVWIGKVPANWRIENPKYHFLQRQERATKDMVQLTASQKYGVVTQAEYMELTGARVVVVQKDFDILKKVCAGDFVIHMRSFQGGLEYSTKTGSISSAYVMLIPKESIAEPRYYRWFFKSSAYIDALSSTSNLIRDGQAMRWANFIQLPITIPPAEEQVEIADFLDARCAEVDSIIADKKSQFETLESYKKSLIFEYVTGKKEVPEPITVVSIDPHVLRLAMIADMPKRSKGEIADQKLLYLCDVYLGLGLSTQYYRYDYGPFDKQLYSYIDTLVSNNWYSVDTQDRAKILVKAKNHEEALEMYENQLSQNKSDIEKLVQYFRKMRMGEVERFATLFAVWNDFIIDGIATPSDNQIIDDVLTNWGPKKGRFSRSTWQNTLMKMKRDGIIPKGLGLHTLPKPEGGKSDA